jgi:cytochrome c553
MTYFLCCLGLAVLPAWGQSTAVAPVVLYTHFERRPSQAVADSMRREVASIMAPLGFPFEWLSVDGVRGDETASELAVVTFRGNCGIANLLAPTKDSGPLGFSRLSGDTVIPFAEVDCERARGLLRKDLLRMRLEEGEAVFGRALGRVLAHELFHVFVGTKHHGSVGVAESAFTSGELLSDRFQFGTADFRVLRAGLKPARRQNSRLRSEPSPLSGRFIFEESGCASCHGAAGQGTQSAPALHVSHKLVDAKNLTAKLAQDVMSMYRRAKSVWLPAPELDDDEIADVVSFLNGWN